MRKIKECICDSTEKTEDGIFSICLSYFIINMAILLVLDSDMRLATPVPDLHTGGTLLSGEAKEEPSVLDIKRVLKRDDLIRGTGQFIQLQGFLEWILEQDEPEEPKNGDDFVMWYDIEFLGKKWNEYVRMKKGESE